MKLYLVSGAHHEVPNVLSTAHLTPAAADASALNMVNMIRADAPRDGMDSDEQTPPLAPLTDGADWRAGLREAQRCILSFGLKIELDSQTLGRLDDGDLARESHANVEIVELTVDVPEPAAIVRDVLDAGQRAAEALADHAELHSDDEDTVYELSEALHLLTLAGVWQDIPVAAAPKPHVIVEVSGGMVQDVYSDQPMTFRCIDFDTEGVDEVIDVPQPDGTTSEAYRAHRHDTTVNPEFIRAVEEAEERDAGDEA